jgi:hypothetical protein
VRAIARRLARLEVTFIPQENEKTARLTERIRRARLRAAECTGSPEAESPPLAPDDYDEPPLSLGERILRARHEQLRRQEAAKQL